MNISLCQGECAEEFFLVSGGSPVPTLCGVNNKQHLIYRLLAFYNYPHYYILMCSVTPDSGPSQLSIILSVSTVMAQTSNARLWNVRIYQVLSLYTVIYDFAFTAASLPISNIPFPLC